MNKSLSNKIEFLFHSVQTEEFATFGDKFDTKSSINVNTSIDVKINQFEKRIGIFVTFHYLQKKRVFLKIKVACHFSVSESSWNQLVDVKSRKLILPKGFITHLLVLSIGTVRGILVAKTEGTAFSTFILPTMNVSDKIKNDFMIELDEKREFA